MQPKFLVLLAITFGFGMAATFAFINAAKLGGSQKQAETMVAVYVATENIEGSAKLSPAQFSLAQWPLSRLPEGAIQELEQFEGKYTKQNLFVGEPLIDCKITGIASGMCCGGCLPLLPPGAKVPIFENSGDLQAQPQ